MGEPIEPMWDYWCPAEGTHVIHPNELHVGIVSVNDQGEGFPVHVAAIIPPIDRDGPMQAEAFARVCRDALAAAPWHAKDGFAAGLVAHGSPVVMPRSLPPVAPNEGGEG